MRPSIYFSGFNGARMIAAFAVMVHHVEQIKSIEGLPNTWMHVGTFSLGKQGVDFFFVLSGFLITYLLYAQREATGDISVKDFYLRRIFRIWPLYFLVILSTFLILPGLGPLGQALGSNLLVQAASDINGPGYFAKLIMNIFMLPNLAIALFPAVWFAAQAWSVGLEEQFYLIWPVALKLFKFRCDYLALTVILIKVIFLFALANWIPHDPAHQWWVNFADGFKIECLAIGALVGYYYFLHKERVQRLALLPRMLAFTPLYLILLLLRGQTFTVFGLAPLLYSVILVNLAAGNWRFLSLENPVFNYLGKISFGIYMYQIQAVAFTIVGLKAMGVLSTTHSTLNNFLIYPISAALTVACAALSYRYYEAYFLRLKPGGVSSPRAAGSKSSAVLAPS